MHLGGLFPALQAAFNGVFLERPDEAPTCVRLSMIGPPSNRRRGLAVMAELRGQGNLAVSMFGTKSNFTGCSIGRSETASTTESERDRVVGPSHVSVCVGGLFGSRMRTSRFLNFRLAAAARSHQKNR